MRKNLLFIFSSTLIAIASVVLFQQNANTYNSGAPSGRTGAPGESTCQSGCHTGANLNSGSAINSITSNIPASGFVGGETYTVTVTSSQAGISKFGFEIAAENASGSNIGSWIITNSTETQITGSNYVTHKSSGTSGSGTKSWSMNWKAPCAGEDTVIFYSAVNVANGNGFNSGDTIYTLVRGFDENLINVADTVGNLAVQDNGDNYDGRDLVVSFRTSKCEERTDEYRVIAVKASKTGTFDIAAAGNVTSGNYAVVPTGTPNSNKTKNFGVGGNDSDGDPIQNNQPYNVFILSKANTSLVSNDTMLGPSPTITLTSPMASVNGIDGSDLGNAGNASDLEVEFTTPANEGTISEYRSIVVKSSKSSTFTKADANALASNLYKVSTTGNPGMLQTVNYMAGDMDSDGDTLDINLFYHIFVLSKADGINSISDTLQKSADSVFIDHPEGIVRNIAKDISIVQLNAQLIIKNDVYSAEQPVVEIFTLNGQKVYGAQMQGQQILINLHDVNTHIGIVRVSVGNEAVSKKFIN